jgi:glycosyltransferase involved in cell wall biosynthesis
LDLLSSYHALFLPSKGENFGHVILEAFMAGRPVLISDQTPWINLEQAACGFDLPLSNPLAFVEKLEDWAELDEERFQSLALKSFEKAQQFCEDPELIAASKALFLPT